MIRWIPVFSTIVVLAAVVTMIALGVWQLGRMDEKAELLARYTAAANAPGEVGFPIAGDGTQAWFRRSRIGCDAVRSISSVSGTSALGGKGWVHRATCASGVIIDLGYSRDIAKPVWTGGEVTGVIAPGPRLVADPPLAGLQAMAKPDPGDLPNNHLAYAGQWFFFALTALVIYVLAIRARRS